jgi:hypothetical protein
MKNIQRHNELQDQRMKLIARKIEIQQQFSQIKILLEETLPYKQYLRIQQRRNNLTEELSGIELQITAVNNLIAEHKRMNQPFIVKLISRITRRSR